MPNIVQRFLICLDVGPIFLNFKMWSNIFTFFKANKAQAQAGKWAPPCRAASVRSNPKMGVRLFNDRVNVTHKNQ